MADAPDDINIQPEQATPAAPESAASSTPAATPAAPPQKVEPVASQKAEPMKGEGQSFTNIFSAKKDAPKPEDSKMMDQIIEQKTAKKARPILGKAPTIQKSIEKEKNVNQKKRLRLVQSIFAFIAFAFGAMAFYFYSQLSPSFDLLGQNVTLELQDVNSKMAGLQTQLNKYRYLAVQLDLNSFSVAADEFLDKTEQLSSANGAQAQQLGTDVAQLSQNLSAQFASIKEKLTPSLVIETYRSAAEEEKTPEQIEQEFETALRTAISEDRGKLQQDSELGELYRQDLKLYDNALKLVGNVQLMNTVSRTSTQQFDNDLTGFASTGDPEVGQKVRDFMSNMLSSTKSDLATVGFIKSQRIAWSEIIDQINTVTIKVDPGFGNLANCELSSCIVYTGYEFDTRSNQIILSGFTRTNDVADNFTRISEMIDELERSTFFANVEMRSFTKSGSVTDGYRANFKISLGLEEDDSSVVSQAASLVRSAIARTALPGRQAASSMKKGVARPGSDEDNVVKRPVKTPVKRAQSRIEKSQP